MRIAGLLALGCAPAVAIGYVLLLGYLLNRVRPVPITFLPRFAAEAPAARARRRAAPSILAPSGGSYPACGGGSRAMGGGPSRREKVR